MSIEKDHNQIAHSVDQLTDKEKEKLKGVIKELSNSFTRIEGERDFQKEAIKKLNEEIGVDKKMIRRLAKAYHNANLEEIEEENQKFSDFAREIL